LKRQIEKDLIDYLDNRLALNGLALYALKKKDARTLLVEAAKTCVGVREATGKNDGPLVRLFQETIGSASGEPWCFPGETEILTLDGWQRFDELSRGSLVAQVSDDESISFDYPMGYIEKEYNGEGYRISNRSVDIVCDKGHRFYGHLNNSKDRKFFTLDQVTTSAKFTKAKSSSSGCGLSEGELEFLAAFISDGFMSKTRQLKPRIRMQVSKDRKIKSLEKMHYVGRHTASKAYGMTKTPLTTFSFNVPDFFQNIFESYKVLSWKFIFSLSQEDAQVFLKHYSNFDGSIDGGSYKLFSSSRENVDRLCVIATLAGYTCYETSAISKLSGKPSYVLTISLQKKTKHIRKEDISKISLKQTLYCVSMKQGRIIIRDRNNNPVVVGNCMSFMQSMIAYAEIKTGATSPIYASEYCTHVWTKTPNEQRVKKIPLPGAIAIWHKKDSTDGHTGILTSYGDKNFYAVEGNTTSGLSSSEEVVAEGGGVYYTKRSNSGSATMILRGFLKPF